jgi:hypothetical protein
MNRQTFSAQSFYAILYFRDFWTQVRKGNIGSVERQIEDDRSANARTAAGDQSPFLL